MIDLLEIEDFLDTDTLRGLVAELRAAAGGPATLLAQQGPGTLDTRVRRATRIAVSPETRDMVTRRLMDHKAALERHFGLALDDCEEPQFLRYTRGDYFVAHQDGNTPLIHDRSRFRKVSAVVFLSAQSEEPADDSYGGGELVFHGPYLGPTLRVPVAPAPGTLVAFRSETTHEVVPVTHGERYTIATWFRQDAE